MYFHLFGLLWNSAFLLTCSHFIIATSTCIWYFNRKEKHKTHPVLKSVIWMVVFHLGTVAFGSLILALVYLLRLIAQYIHVSSKCLTHRKR
jgi:solute carrier family 44 (choline transporter-like protein), member 2/4/5